MPDCALHGCRCRSTLLAVHGTGYVDDVNGYGFASACTSTSASGACTTCGGSPSPSPSLSVDHKFYHGTHVAGLVAAVQNNQQGMTGVAAGVQIMALRVSVTQLSSGCWLVGSEGWAIIVHEGKAAIEHTVEAKNNGADKANGHGYHRQATARDGRCGPAPLEVRLVCPICWNLSGSVTKTNCRPFPNAAGVGLHQRRHLRLHGVPGA